MDEQQREVAHAQRLSTHLGEFGFRPFIREQSYGPTPSAEGVTVNLELNVPEFERLVELIAGSPHPGLPLVTEGPDAAS